MSAHHSLTAERQRWNLESSMDCGAEGDIMYKEQTFIKTADFSWKTMRQNTMNTTCEALKEK